MLSGQIILFLFAALALAATVGGSGDSPEERHRFSIRRWLKHTLFGKPINSKHAEHQKLGVLVGLPVFSSDALSSVAYATEAILGVLILAGTGHGYLMQPITWAICGLILIVAFSYLQTIKTYPGGGGSYIVASDNLGKMPGLIAGGALLIDYILTVAVSVAAGVAAITSAIPALHPYLTVIAVACIILISWANLRGMKESGAAFALPTYTFVVLIITMLTMALFKVFQSPPVDTKFIGEPGVVGSEATFPMIYIVLRAFAAGCTALTGIEAVSDGVQAFKAPSATNASKTLILMSSLLITMFAGLGYIAMHLPVVTLFATKNPEHRTLVSQIAAHTFGNGTVMFYIIQFATAAILILAANTAFADFPRLASFLARDGFMPRSLMRQGDRLVFQNGIILLGVSAIALVIYFHGELDLLLPLYAVGVFTAFTLSQSGMVAHWLKLKPKGWVSKLIINGVGTIVTFAVALVILVTKFGEGAWIVCVLIAMLVAMFLWISNRYAAMKRQMELPEQLTLKKRTHTALVLVPRLHRGIVRAIEYASHMDSLRGIHVTFDPKAANEVVTLWDKHIKDVPLVVLNSPYRSLTEPIMEYVDQMIEEDPDRVITVVIAEAYSIKLVHRLLHDSVATQMKAALGTRRNVIVSSVRYFLY